MKRFFLSRGRFAAFFVALNLACCAQAAGPLSEYDVKAGFLFNLTRFVQWPESALSSPQAPIVIGILGSNPFGSTLDELVQGEDVSGRRIVVKRFGPKDDFTQCQILFISRSESANLAGLLGRLQGLPILTVSDVDRFVGQGGTVGLVVDGGRVRIHINLASAKSAQLNLSAKLLRSATIIDGPHSQVTPVRRWYEYVSDVHGLALVVWGNAI